MNLDDMQIAKDIDAELADQEHQTMTHGTAYCYGKGCKGPICRKGNRDRKRKSKGIVMEPYPFDEYIEFRYNQYMASRGSGAA